MGNRTDSSSFTDLHRVMVQALMSRRAVEESVAMQLHKRAFVAVNGREPRFKNERESLQNIVQEIADMIREYDLDIARIQEQEGAGRRYFCLVNTTSINEASEPALSVSDLSPLEISYFREIVMAIVESYPAFSIGAKHAIRIASGLATPMTNTTAVAILKALTNRYWLRKSSRGRYNLGLRSQIELLPWLKETYGDPDTVESELKLCGHMRCPGKGKELVFSGWSCQHPDCNIHLHNQCKLKLESVKRPRCPGCRGSWDVENDGIELAPIGEAAVPPEQDNQVGSTRRKKRNATAADADEPEESDGEEVFEEEDEVGDVAVETSRPARSTRNHQNVNEVPETQMNGEDDDDEDEDEDSD